MVKAMQVNYRVIMKRKPWVLLASLEVEAESLKDADVISREFLITKYPVYDEQDNPGYTENTYAALDLFPTICF